MNVMEAIEESPFASILSSLHDGSFTEVSVVARLISLLLFCISAFVFNYIILRAMEEDESAAAPVWQCSCGRVN